MFSIKHISNRASRVFQFGKQFSTTAEVKPTCKPFQFYPVTERLTVPPHILRPGYAQDPPTTENVRNMNAGDRVCVKDDDELPKFRRACALAAEVRAYAGSLVKPGITPDAIDKLTHEFVISKNAYPSPLGFMGFPKSLCSSVNQVVVHGIPDLRPLEEGDIVNFDVSVFLDGYHGDCSATFYVGAVDDQARQLVEVTRESLKKAVSICAPGVPLTEIGETITALCKDKYNYGVVESFTGHGIGRQFHTAPNILHHRNNRPGVMEKNMTFTIEPAINEGPSHHCIQLNDGWTCITTDGTRSAQFEEVILITDDGAEILTVPSIVDIPAGP